MFIWKCEKIKLLLFVLVGVLLNTRSKPTIIVRKKLSPRAILYAQSFSSIVRAFWTLNLSTNYCQSKKCILFFFYTTHSLIFARFNWLLHVTWCRITVRLSRNNPRLHRYLSSDFISPSKRNKASRKNQHKSFTFSFLLFYIEEKQTRFVESSTN